ncbi:galactoside 2-L-fucosyltransferase [Hollandina sp. SP2]
MFHYAFYKYLTLAGFNVFLDKNSLVGGLQHEKHETFRLNYFDLPNINYASREDVWEFLPKQKEIYYKRFLDVCKNESFLVILDVIFHKIIVKIITKLRIGTYWVEWDSYTGKDFYRKRLTKNTKAYMVGRYQEYYYLENIREELLRDFSFSQSLPVSVNQYKLQITLNNSVSIHARRGDYSGKKEFDVCTIAYYKNAVEYIQKMEKNLVYYIFSDDLEWARNNFTFLDNYYVIDNSQYTNSDYYDLYLMSICKHNIIPNSTFSWWAAYLNKNSNKIIVCPDTWNGLDLVLTDEICPKDWKRISVL